jgi:hypothetical protein
MFRYNLTYDNPRGPMVEILDGANVIDESGPWESIESATTWAEAYVGLKNSNESEPEVG